MCLLCMADYVLSNDVRVQNVLFYMCCYHQASFKSIYNTGDKIVQLNVTADIFRCCSELKIV